MIKNLKTIYEKAVQILYSLCLMCLIINQFFQIATLLDNFLPLQHNAQRSWINYVQLAQLIITEINN